MLYSMILFYILSSATPGNAPTIEIYGSVPTDKIVLLVDVSGSMEFQISEVHRRVRDILEHFSDSGKIRVFLFQERIRALHSGWRRLPDKNLVDSIVRSIVIDDMGPLATNIDVSMRLVLESVPDENYSLIVVTDGEDNVSAGGLPSPWDFDSKAILKARGSRSIPIHTWSMSHVDNACLDHMKVLARQTNGFFIWEDKVGSIVEEEVSAPDPDMSDLDGTLDGQEEGQNGDSEASDAGNTGSSQEVAGPVLHDKGQAGSTTKPSGPNNRQGPKKVEENNTPGSGGGGMVSSP